MISDSDGDRDRDRDTKIPCMEDIMVPGGPKSIILGESSQLSLQHEYHICHASSPFSSDALSSPITQISSLSRPPRNVTPRLTKRYQLPLFTFPFLLLQFTRTRCEPKSILRPHFHSHLTGG